MTTEISFVNYCQSIDTTLGFYGFISNPLTNENLWRLFVNNISKEDAYSIACDVYCGIQFSEVLEEYL